MWFRGRWRALAQPMSGKGQIQDEQNAYTGTMTMDMQVAGR